MATSHWITAIMVGFFFITGPDSYRRLTPPQHSPRPQILQYAADLRYFVIVRLIPQRFLQRVVIPLSHRTSVQQVIRVGDGCRIEGEPVGLDPERHRRIEGVDRGKCLTGKIAATEAAQSIVPERAEPGD